MKVGILSDTHGFWDEKFEAYLGECDEIWHAGDIGSMEVADRFETLGPRFRAVYGNIDDYYMRSRYQELLRFEAGGVDVLIKHIGGYPGRYDYSVGRIMSTNPPKLFISGHSHILKIMPDKQLGLLHINPGAAGLSGWQTERTLVRLTIENGTFADCEVITLGGK